MKEDILPLVLKTKWPLSDIRLLSYKQNSFGCFLTKVRISITVMGPVICTLIGPFLGQVIGLVMYKVMGPVMGQVIGPVMYKVMGPVRGQVIGPVICTVRGLVKCPATNNPHPYCGHVGGGLVWLLYQIMSSKFMTGL